MVTGPVAPTAVAAGCSTPWVAACSTPWVAAIVRGPLRVGRVVGRGPFASYVELDAVDGHAGGRGGASGGGECFGLLAAGAVAVPIGLRTRLERLPEHGDTVRIGGGTVIFGDTAVAVRRIVDARAPWLAAPSGVLRALHRAVSGSAAVHHAAAELDPHALRLLGRADAAAVHRLLGGGSGLTPVGDDVLAGFLVAARAVGRTVQPVATAVRRSAAQRTTTVSASLLCRACVGEAIPELRALLRATAAGDDVRPALRGLLDIGHTSGAGLALGVALAVESSGSSR